MQKRLGLVVWLALVCIVTAEVIIATNLQNSSAVFSLPIAFGSPSSDTSVRQIGIPIGALSLVLLAIIQAIVVLLFYMDFRHHTIAVKLALFVPFLFVLLLLVMMVFSNVH